LEMEDRELRTLHLVFLNVNFDMRRGLDESAVGSRCQELEVFHPKRQDCLVLAEAEQARHAVLLSYDTKFVKRLKQHANLRLDTPKAYWDSLGIPRGAKPNKAPHPSNPRAGETWWVW